MQELPAAESGHAVPWPPWIPQDAELQTQVLSCCLEVQLGASRVRAEGGHIIPGGQVEHPACSPWAPLIKRIGRETLSQVTPQEPWVQASEEKRGVKCHPRLSQHHRLTPKVKASQTKPALIYRLRLTLPLTAFYTVCMSRVVSFTEHLLWATRWGILPVGGDGV